MSGSYKINGTELDPQPTEGRWLPREVIAVDGNLQAIYPMYHEFEMTWQLTDPAQVSQLYGFFTGMNEVGDIVADLPKYMNAVYAFFPYSGCVLRELTMGAYFTEHHQEINLLVSKIRT